MGPGKTSDSLHGYVHPKPPKIYTIPNSLDAHCPRLEWPLMRVVSVFLGPYTHGTLTFSHPFVVLLRAVRSSPPKVISLLFCFVF